MIEPNRFAAEEILAYLVEDPGCPATSSELLTYLAARHPSRVILRRHIIFGILTLLASRDIESVGYRNGRIVYHATIHARYHEQVVPKTCRACLITFHR